jgi:hypothetical protein
MMALPIRGGESHEREAFIGGEWVFHYVPLIGALLAQRRNPCVVLETTSLPEECASEIAALMDFWTRPIDADITRH